MNKPISIKELADELGVSKQAIRKHLPKIPPHCVSVGANRTTLINAEGARILRALVTSSVTTETPLETPPETPVITALLHQLEVKDAQLAAKDEQIEKLTALLDHEQQLHGKTMQLIPAAAIETAAAAEPATPPAEEAATPAEDPRHRRKFFSRKKER